MFAENSQGGGEFLNGGIRREICFPMFVERAMAELNSIN
jgi:hypothetical protein